MSHVPEPPEDLSGLVPELLGARTLAGRRSLLAGRSLLDEAGLGRLVEEADGLLASDPEEARRLAEVCIELAGEAGAPGAVPQAQYVIAGYHDFQGEFEEALAFTRLAREGYDALGWRLEALRTEVGRMSELLGLERYAEVLAVGEELLGALREEGYVGTEEEPEAAREIIARARMNLGVACEYLGRYEESIRAYRTSERLFAGLGMREELNEVRNNRALVLLSLGRGSEALGIFQEAAAEFAGSGQVIPYAGTLTNLGYAYLQLGDCVRSLEAFEEARGLMESRQVPADRHVLVDTADAYAYLNLHSEALSAYREAKRLLAEAGMMHEVALAAWGMGEVLTARGELDAAEEALREARRVFEGSQNVPLLSGVTSDISRLLAARGEREAALRCAREALDLVSEGEDWPLQRFDASLTLAELSLPDAEEAERYLKLAGELLERMSLPHLRYRYREALGHLRSLQGRVEEAVELYEGAIAEIESLRRTFTRDSMRAAFLGDKVSVYEGLLRLTLEAGSPALRAFEVAEQAKSRALADLLAGVVPAGERSGGDGELAGRLASLQSRLGGIYDALLGRGEVAPTPELQRRAVELEEEIGRLRLRLEVSQRAGAPDPFAAPGRGESVPERLAEDTVVLAYHVVGEELLAFVLFGGEVRVVRRVGDLSAVRSLLGRLEAQWDRFRSGREFGERQLALLEKSTRRVLAGLYDELFRPVEGLLARASGGSGPGEVPKLAVVPHGPLHQVPFHALFDRSGYVIDHYEVSYAPSAAVFALCQERAPGEARERAGALVVGVPDALIPAAREEALAVSELFREGEGRALLAGEATLPALRREVAGRSVVHLACHGMFRSDNPMFSALKLGDGWLSASEVMKLDLAGATVALSACESGRNVVVGGDEVLGLTRAFLGAGAATLLVSLWIVQDDTTVPLMRSWHEKLRRDVAPAKALREAQIEARKRHPHPYYWAPFIVVGRR